MSTLAVGTVKSISSTAPVFQNTSGTEIGQLAKAWVNFNGTGTIAIRDSFNVSSLTDHAVGRTTVTMTNAMPDTNFVVVGSSGATSTDALRNLGLFNSFTTTTFTVFTIYFPDTSSFGRDDELVCCAVFGG